MPIRNVTSNLPDKDYITALESELAGLRADVDRLLTEISALRGGSRD